MERTLFDKDGNAIAYFSDDYNASIYLWDGSPVAYLHDDSHIFGFNGRHLGWFIDEIIYDNSGQRIGFTSSSCPVPTAKEPVKSKKYPMDQIQSKWNAPPLPSLSFNSALQDLADFLKQGRVPRFGEEKTAEEIVESEASDEATSD